MLKVVGLGCLLAAVSCSAADVVISQIYTAGGNANALYQNDFVELHNRGSTPVSLSGWTLQYAVTNFWSVTFLGGTLQPGQYYLIGEGSGGSSGSILPPENAGSSVNFSTTSGKVALVRNTVTLSNACPSDPAIVDFVGYGVIVNCSEGTAAPASGATNALMRINNGCTDTDNNATDFVLAAPNPRNTFATANVCPNPTPIFTSARLTNGAFVVTFTADTAKSNQVQFSLNLVTWSNLAIAVQNAGTFLTFTDTNVAATRKYYRVVQQ